MTPEELANKSLPKNRQLPVKEKVETPAPVIEQSQTEVNNNQEQHVETESQQNETQFEVNNNQDQQTENQSINQNESETENSTSADDDEPDFSWLDESEENPEQVVEEWNPNATEEPSSTEQQESFTQPTEQEQQVPVTQFNYEGLSEVLGSQVTSIEDVQRIVGELKQTKENGSFANSLIKEANEIASQGGDFLNYLQGKSIDYSQISDDEILVTTMRNQYGTRYSLEEIEDHVDSMGAMEKGIQADTIRQNLKYQDDNRIQQIRAKTQFEAKQKVDSIFTELRNTEKIAGRVIDNKQKTKLFNEIKDEQAFIKKLFYDKNGKFDAKKAVYHAYMVDNHQDIIKSSLNRGRSDANSEFMKEANNVTIGRKTSETPYVNNQTKGMSSHEKIMNHNGPIKRIKIPKK